MDKHTPVKEMMTTLLVTVTPDTSLLEVLHEMERNDVHHMPVVDAEGALQGILSMSDIRSATMGAEIFRNEHRNRQTEAMLASLLAEEVMQKKVVHLSPDDTIETAVGFFRENRFHALPICSGKDLTGIITPMDIINFAMR